MASDLPTRFELVHELGSWEVTLRSGDVLEIAAHGYSEDDNVYTFSALMEGAPPFEVEVARVPRELVEKIRGG